MCDTILSVEILVFPVEIGKDTTTRERRRPRLLVGHSSCSSSIVDVHFSFRASIRYNRCICHSSYLQCEIQHSLFTTRRSLYLLIHRPDVSAHESFITTRKTTTQWSKRPIENTESDNIGMLFPPPGRLKQYPKFPMLYLDDDFSNRWFVGFVFD